MVARIAIAAPIGLLPVAPAHAAGTAVLPDPSGITLFALGIAGVLIGRQLASKRRD